MRFIVDLYRYIIVIFCGIALIGGAILLFAALDPGGPLAGAFPEWVIGASIFAAILFIQSVGGLALLVSLHDRHAALANTAYNATLALERIADRIEGRLGQEPEA